MSVRLSRSSYLAVLFAITGCWFPNGLRAEKKEAAGRAADIESRKAQLFSLFDEEWQYELKANPEMATGLGDNRYNDRLNDRSPRSQALRDLGRTGSAVVHQIHASDGKAATQTLWTPAAKQA